MEAAMRRTTAMIALAAASTALDGAAVVRPQTVSAAPLPAEGVVAGTPTPVQYYYQDPDDWRRREYWRERRRAEDQARIEDAARREAWRIEQERAQRRAERRAWRDERRWREEHWRREQWEQPPQYYGPPGGGVIIQRSW
jgi:hypothetical protein